MGTTMELTFEKVLEAFDAALELVEDPEQRTRLTRVIQASQASVERATQDLVAGLVEEVNTKLGESQIELRHTQNGLDISVVAAPTETPDEDSDGPWRYADSEVEKVTLRVPVELKDRASNSAKESGLSLNAWFTRLLARELHEPGLEPEPEHRRERRRERGHERRAKRHARRGGREGGSLKGWIGQ